MRINEIICESYDDDLVTIVQDLLSIALSKDIKAISKQKFIDLLAKQGFTITDAELVPAINATGFSAMINGDQITFANNVGGKELPPTVDVGDVAGNQAMKDIKAEL